MAKGYWVACVNVKNQNEFNKYVELAGPENLHGGKFLVRGGKVLNIEGKQYERIVISFLIPLKKQKNVINLKNINMQKHF